MNQIAYGTAVLALVAALILAGAGVKLSRDPQSRRRGVLMLIAAAVIVMNVMIVTV